MKAKATVNRTPKPRGRKRKLPKMNNSERGKYYRQKYKAYETNLVSKVDALQQNVHKLQSVLVRLQQQEFEAIIPQHSFMALLREYLSAIAGKTLYLNDFAEWAKWLLARNDGPAHTMLQIMQRWEKSLHKHTILCFEHTSFQVMGTSQAPVIRTQGVHHTVLSSEAIGKLFPFTHTNEKLRRVLLGKQVDYPTVTHFFLQADGSLAHVEIETDYMQGLWQAFGDVHFALWLTEFLVHPPVERRLPSHCHTHATPILPRLSIAVASAATVAIVQLPQLQSMRLAHILS